MWDLHIQKAVIISSDKEIMGHSMMQTGFKLDKASEKVYDQILKETGLSKAEIGYAISTGYGRHMVPYRDSYHHRFNCYRPRFKLFLPQNADST